MKRYVSMDPVSINSPAGIREIDMKRIWLSFLIRLQESLRCTRREAVVLVSLLSLYGAGLVIQHVRTTLIPYDSAFYAPGDSLFQVLSAAELEPTGAPIIDVIADTLDIPPEFPLDLNTASDADLQHLPRIGPALSGRILAHRKEIGAFSSVDQLLDVSGIGEKTLERLRPLVQIQSESDNETESGSPGS